MQKILVIMATAIIALLAFKSSNQFIVTGKITDNSGQHRLALIGFHGKNMPVENLPPRNLVFLIDVSGFMNES